MAGLLNISPHPHPELFKIDFTPLTNPRKGMSEWERKERVRPETNILNDFFRKANKGERGQSGLNRADVLFINGPVIIVKYSRTPPLFQFSKKSNFKGNIRISSEPPSPSYRIYFMNGPLNLSIIYLLRVLLIRSTKTMIKIKRPQNIRRLKLFVGPKYLSAKIFVGPNFRLPKIFVFPKYSSAQNIRRPKIFVGPNFRHLLKISSIRADKVWTDKVYETDCNVYDRVKICKPFPVRSNLFLVS